MLLAGPYDDEFGHELFNFQGYIRRLSLDHEKTVVCTRRSMNFLYEDFADEFVDLNCDLGSPKYAQYTLVGKDDRKVSRGSGINSEEQKFIKYGGPTEEKYDVIIHARTKSEGMYPNLNNEVYDSLFNELKEQQTVAFIGTKKEAYCPRGATDLRDIPLKRLADILYECGLVVGGSSGPMHFASLCGARHLTWGGYRLRTFYRYAHYWNPFKTKCYIFENSDGLGYLKRRGKTFGLAKEAFDAEHVTVIDEKDPNVPSLEGLKNSIINILNG